MNRRAVAVLASTILAACSSGGGDGAADTGPADEPPPTATSTTVAQTTVPTAVTGSSVDDVGGTAPVSTDRADEPASTELVGTAPSGTGPAGTGPTTIDAPFVINGPAAVDETEDGSGPTTGPTSGPTSEPTSGCGGVPRGVSEITLDAGGAVHDVRIFVPDPLLAEPVPVVLNWHGLGSDGPQQAAYSGYEELAAEEGFIVVHPTGVPAPGDSRNSWELAAFDLPGRDDLAFADALIDEMVTNWCGDAERIYSTGMSNGGFFTAELVCSLADRIAAAASVAGVAHAPSCEPDRPVPYLAFHGTDDDVVPFDGSGDSVLADDSIGNDGFFTQVMPEEFAEFAADAGCDPEPIRTEETPEVIRYDYTGCSGDTPLTFYELPGSGHTWPGSPLAGALGDTFGYHTDDIEAAADGWEFFRQHRL